MEKYVRVWKELLWKSSIRFNTFKKSASPQLSLFKRTGRCGNGTKLVLKMITLLTKR